MNSGPTILILDDDDIILLALEETLKLEGYNCLATSSYKEAVEFLNNNTFSVVLSDQRMADIIGTDFLSFVKKVQPNASRILITGVLSTKTLLDAINTSEVFRFVSKPWIREDLLKIVAEAHDRFNQLQASTELQNNLLGVNKKLAEENKRLRQLIEKSEIKNV